MVSVLVDLPAPIMPRYGKCAANELMARSRKGLRRFDSADHFMGLSSQSSRPEKPPHQPNQNDHCIKGDTQRKTRLKVECLKNGETRHRAASTGSLNHLKSWVQSDRVWCATETVRQIELEADVVPESSKPVRKRRASLPEAHIQPDTSIAPEAVWAFTI